MVGVCMHVWEDVGCVFHRHVLCVCEDGGWVCEDGGCVFHRVLYVVLVRLATRCIVADFCKKTFYMSGNLFSEFRIITASKTVAWPLHYGHVTALHTNTIRVIIYMRNSVVFTSMFLSHIYIYRCIAVKRPIYCGQVIATEDHAGYRRSPREHIIVSFTKEGGVKDNVNKNTIKYNLNVFEEMLIKCTLLNKW